MHPEHVLSCFFLYKKCLFGPCQSHESATRLVIGRRLYKLCRLCRLCKRRLCRRLSRLLGWQMILVLFDILQPRGQHGGRSLAIWHLAIRNWQSRSHGTFHLTLMRLYNCLVWTVEALDEQEILTRKPNIVHSCPFCKGTQVKPMHKKKGKNKQIENLRSLKVNEDRR